MNKLIFENSFKHRFARHFAFFILTILFFAIITYLRNEQGTFGDALFVTFANALFFFGYAYITIFLLIPEYLIKQKILLFMLLFVLVGIGLSAIKLIVSDHMFYSSISPENIQRSGMMNLRSIIVNTKDMTFIVALFCILKYAKDYIYSEKIRKTLEIQNKKAQGKLLQSQFDPHFLFNTINNLYALSLLNPLQTLDVIKRIKTVLGYIIEESQKQFVQLEDEISLVENYIQLEKLRYGKRLNIDLEKSGNIRDFIIPPMVLFFLVENCFKHGSSLDAGNPWIKVKIDINGKQALIVTENSIPKTHLHTDLNENGGHGLLNFKKRLELNYPNDRFRLNINRNSKAFKVTLELKNIEFEKSIEKYRMD